MYVTTADKTELYVKDWNPGKGSGPTVILIHGWPLSADSWDDQAMALCEAACASLPTIDAASAVRRSRGRATTTTRWPTTSRRSRKQCGATDAALVGFSMGGGEVARYMSRHGGKGVSKAVLVSSVVPYMLKTDDNPDGTPKSTFDEMTERHEEGTARSSSRASSRISTASVSSSRARATSRRTRRGSPPCRRA